MPNARGQDHNQVALLPMKAALPATRSRKEDAISSTKANLIHWSTVALMMLTAIGSHAQKETIQAHAFGTTLAAGRSFNVTIRIEEYSTPEDQKALIDAFTRGGHDELVKVLSKMKSKGRVAVTGDVGYQIAYIRNIPGNNGRTIRIITDRPINIGETMGYQRSREYDLSLLELHINEEKDKSNGTLVVGGRFKVDKKKNQIYFETYRNTPWRLTNIMER